jgi:MFS transporter, ACS family, tartrate transporter
MTDDRVFVKCAWRLIPFMGLLYLVNFIDRVNVGFAALTMNKDLGFSPAMFGFGAGIFFFSYALFIVPSSLIIERVGARRSVFCIMAAWGVISAANAFVQGRFLLRPYERTVAFAIWEPAGIPRGTPRDVPTLT